MARAPVRLQPSFAALSLDKRRLSTEAAAPAPAPAEEAAPPGRFVPTIEVIVSKIFPAGFGWQAASVVAGNQGFEADTLNFALTTGAGDFAGVFAGHTTFSLLKFIMGYDKSVDVTGGLWLGSAAFCSGTAWQPTVNVRARRRGTPASCFFFLSRASTSPWTPDD